MPCLGGYTEIIGRLFHDIRAVNAKDLRAFTRRSIALARAKRLAAEEAQDALRGLVGLRQDGLASLLQDTRLGEVDHLRRHVDVADAALGSGQVLLGHAEVADGVLQAVLVGTQCRALVGDVGDGRVDLGQRTVGAVSVLAVAADYKFTITNAGTAYTETGGTASTGVATTGTITVGSTGFTITAGETATTFAAAVNTANIGVTATVNGSGALVFTSTTKGSTSTIGAITGTGTLTTDMGINAFTATAAGANAAGFYQVNGETATHALTASATQLTAGSGTSAVNLDSTTIGASVTGTVSSRMRWRIECVSLSAPSAVWIIEIPSCALR